MIGVVVEVVGPVRPRGRGKAWERCQAERNPKISDLFARRGQPVPEGTLHRFCTEELGHGRKNSTVPVVDGEPSGEVQVDFGRSAI